MDLEAINLDRRGEWIVRVTIYPDGEEGVWTRSGHEPVPGPEVRPDR